MHISYTCTMARPGKHDLGNGAYATTCALLPISNAQSQGATISMFDLQLQPLELQVLIAVSQEVLSLVCESSNSKNLCDGNRNLPTRFGHGVKNLQKSTGDGSQRIFPYLARLGFSFVVMALHSDHSNSMQLTPPPPQKKKNKETKNSNNNHLHHWLDEIINLRHGRRKKIFVLENFSMSCKTWI